VLICEAHWAQMQDKAKELGMQHLCSHNSKEAAEYFKSLLTAGASDSTVSDAEWDPLVAMNFNFMKRVLLTIGWVQDCPLCLVRGDFDVHNTETGRCGEDNCDIQVHPHEEPWDLQWIKDCAEAMKDHAASHGMLSLS